MAAYPRRPRPEVARRPPWQGALGVTAGALVVVWGAMDPWAWASNKAPTKWVQTWIQDHYNPHLEDCSKFSLEFLKKRLYFYILPNSVYYWQQHETKKRNHFLTMTWKIYPSNLIIWHPKKIWKNRTKHGFLLFSFFRFSVIVQMWIVISNALLRRIFFWNIHNKIIIPDFFYLFLFSKAFYNFWLQIWQWN